jgi:hypothetical protein
MGCDFQDYLDEQMRDPGFRFWWYVHAPEFWLRGKLAWLLFRIRDGAHSTALWVLGTSIVPVEDEL